MRELLPGPDGDPLRSYVTGQAGFDADRAPAVEGLDGTLLAITGVLVLVLMLLTYRSPLIAALMLGVVAIAYLIATGLRLRARARPARRRSAASRRRS